MFTIGSMVRLLDKIDDALNESRILILSAQVLVGFQFAAAFTAGFPRLPRSAQYLNITALALLLIAMALTIAPAAYHQIAERGENSQRLLDFVIGVVGTALLPFAVALGIDLYIATQMLAGNRAAMIVGVAGTLVALFFWYGLGLAVPGTSRAHGAAPPQATSSEEQGTMEDEQQGGNAAGTPLNDRITNVLTEARMVLPGVQALLGFQFAIMLAEGFDPLPLSSKYVHLASIALTALSTILLITPAAYHRVVERGEDTETFHRLAGRMILASMVPLALSVCCDFYVIVQKVTGSQMGALIAAGLMLLLFYGLWFGYTLAVRGRRERSQQISR